jgi:hypothetical protein
MLLKATLPIHHLGIPGVSTDDEGKVPSTIILKVAITVSINAHLLPPFLHQLSPPRNLKLNIKFITIELPHETTSNYNITTQRNNGSTTRSYNERPHR